MDYIIFGMGTGATLVLAGWLLRELGPRLRDRAPAQDEVLSGSEMVTRMAWARFCGACGMALLLCGLLVLMVTGVTLWVAPEDGAGAMAVLTAFGICALLMLLWTGLYLRQFGTIGIFRHKERKEPAPVAEAVESGGAPAQTFAEATSGRGGFGRFAKFLRRDTTPAETVGEPSRAGQVIEPPPMSPEPAGTDAAESPTDAGVELLTGAAGDEDEKRLSLDDPLVTSVDLPALQGVEDAKSVLVEERASSPDSDPSPETDDAASPDVTTEGSDRSAADAAIDTLRQRRLERLSQKSRKS